MKLLKNLILLTALTSFVSSSQNEEYCGYDQKTYNSIEEAHKAGTKILNCGPCGKCSNKKDIAIYWKTKEDLTKKTRSCAMKTVIKESWGRSCMTKNVGFTSECLDCWMENIKCDRKNCFSVCLKSTILNESYVDKDGKLNNCLQCDEDKCGPAFQQCAGANRRRACISSDIFRDKDTICKSCELDE